MSASPRQHALRAISASSQQPRVLPHQPLPLKELFGSKVFNDEVQRERLAKPVYAKLRRVIEHGEDLDEATADAVANAMKDWAVEMGATHFTHWFQPMTGLTAEKHDSFISPTGKGRAVLEFKGSELISGEPDASSFPSGGLRATFEARGYTAWDPTSPAFLRETPFGSTLMIPSVFCSWTGEALDTKTPLLRSSEAIDKQARRLLRLLGEEGAHRVHTTVGPEQEYFLVDREFYHLRPDLVSCDRTLIGAPPPKGQELEDHYFVATPRRVLNFMTELEQELWKVGVPVRTRHSEVAPSQFEMAPIFEDAVVAIDHNMLAMELLQVVAEKHGLKCLLHEKPFAGVNGSGKHNNWSMADTSGRNLLEPGSTPRENLVFVAFLTAIIRGVDLHQDLLRASIAHAGNDHRLGANEAPPAIISIFLGSELEDVVESLIQGTAPRASGRGSHLKLGVSTLPSLPRHTSDRNRTSPFAFTGNKFEFRAVGSSQSLGYPNIFINTLVADALDHVSTEIEKRGGDTQAAAREVIRELLTEHKRILFSGDNYSAEWRQEAEKRGLLNLTDTPSALDKFASEKNIGLFERHGVFSRREVESRAHIMFETYRHRIGVECLALRNLAATMVLPAAMTFQKQVADSIASAKAAAPNLDMKDQLRLLQEVAETTSRLKLAVDQLGELRAKGEAAGHDAREASFFQRDKILPLMREVRQYADKLETLVDDDLWRLPKYGELLYIH